MKNFSQNRKIEKFSQFSIYCLNFLKQFVSIYDGQMEFNTYTDNNTSFVELFFLVIFLKSSNVEFLELVKFSHKTSPNGQMASERLCENI